MSQNELPSKITGQITLIICDDTHCTCDGSIPIIELLAKAIWSDEFQRLAPVIEAIDAWGSEL